jgi:hypothetical protein
VKLLAIAEEGSNCHTGKGYPFGFDWGVGSHLSHASALQPTPNRYTRVSPVAGIIRKPTDKDRCTEKRWAIRHRGLDARQMIHSNVFKIEHVIPSCGKALEGLVRGSSYSVERPIFKKAKQTQRRPQLLPRKRSAADPMATCICRKQITRTYHVVAVYDAFQRLP